MSKQFHATDLGFSKTPTAELDRIAVGGGRIGHISYGYATRGDVAPRPDGWAAVWVATGGMGNCGSLVLRGTTPRTRALLKQGQVKALQAAGLSAAAADAVCAARAPYKHQLAPVLAQVLQDRAAVRALLAHPGSFGPGSGRADWQRQWAGCLPDAVKALTAPREAALAQLVQAVVWAR